MDDTIYILKFNIQKIIYFILEFTYIYLIFKPTFTYIYTGEFIVAKTDNKPRVVK